MQFARCSAPAPIRIIIYRRQTGSGRGFEFAVPSTGLVEIGGVVLNDDATSRHPALQIGELGSLNMLAFPTLVFSHCLAPKFCARLKLKNPKPEKTKGRPIGRPFHCQTRSLVRTMYTSTQTKRASSEVTIQILAAEGRTFRQ